MIPARLLAFALSGSLTCLAFNAHATDGPYIGFGAHYYQPDKDRSSDEGSGASLYAGFPLTDSGVSLEAQIHGSWINADLAGSLETVAGAGLDLRIPLAQTRYATPFVLGGFGITQSDLSVDDHVDPYLNLGIGALVPLASSLSLRAEGRWSGIVDSETTTDNEWVDEYRVGLGLEYRFGGSKMAAIAPVEPAAEATPQMPVPAEPLPPAELVAENSGVVDSDKDGVSDSLDECPDSAPGVKVDAKGCLDVPPPPPDSDRDGVNNEADQCPDTASGIKVDAKGCAVDEDGDGVLNDQDTCAGTAAGLKVDSSGCVVNQVLVLNSIQFDSASSDLLSESKTILDGIAKSLQNQPTIRVTIIGHTDALGTQASNLTLSQKRAETVKGYLVSRGGIASERLESEGYGEFNPVAPNETKEGRAQNRRVEFRIATPPKP